MAHLVIGSAQDFCFIGPGFEFGISQNDPWGAAGSLSSTVKSQGREGELHLYSQKKNVDDPFSCPSRVVGGEGGGGVPPSSEPSLFSPQDPSVMFLRPGLFRK